MRAVDRACASQNGHGVRAFVHFAYNAASAAALASEDLAQMSLADLAKIEVTSVSKSSEVLQRAPAAIYVISHDEIERSGVTSFPEALRLAPSLLVTQTASSAYVVSARGFNGNRSELGRRACAIVQRNRNELA